MLTVTVCPTEITTLSFAVGITPPTHVVGEFQFPVCAVAICAFTFVNPKIKTAIIVSSSVFFIVTFPIVLLD